MHTGIVSPLKSMASVGRSRPGSAVVVQSGGGSGFTANEPLGMTLLDDCDYSLAGDFTEANSSGSAGGYDAAVLSPPWSPDLVARVVIPAGFSGTSPGQRGLTLPDGTVRLYVAYSTYFSAGYRWHSIVTKQMHQFFVTNESQASCILGIIPDGTPLTTVAGRLNFQQLANPTGVIYATHADNNAVASEVMIEREQWYHIEMLLILNTGSGSDDGVIKLWVDGVLTHDFDNVDFAFAGVDPPTQWKRTKFTPFQGGAADAGPAADQYQYADKSYVSYSTSRS